MFKVTRSSVIGNISRRKSGRTAKTTTGPVSLSLLDELLENVCEDRHHLPDSPTEKDLDDGDNRSTEMDIDDGSFSSVDEQCQEMPSDSLVLFPSRDAPSEEVFSTDDSVTSGTSLEIIQTKRKYAHKF